MKNFARDSLFLFLSFRAGDLVNLAAGMYFVPKFVTQEEIGAVLPVSSFATFLSLPVFAFAMTVMKETSALAANGDRGRIKTLLRGVFAVSAIFLIATLLVSALVMPEFLHRMRISNLSAGYLMAAASLLGCAAPVWTDALQALKRFKALGAVEFVSALSRAAVMLGIMPFKALTGYFAGQAAMPAVRIAASAWVLRKEFGVHGEKFWSVGKAISMTKSFAAILLYQALPMYVSMLELSIVRQSLSAADSAGYYMVSRFSDILHYLALPIILVLFPYAAEAAQSGRSWRSMVVKSSLAVLCAALVLMSVYRFFGAELLSLMPNGAGYASYAVYMPVLTLSTAMTSCQVFHTNSCVAAGRFSFLAWFLPLNAIYAAVLIAARENGSVTTLGQAVLFIFASSLVRIALSAADLHFSARSPNR